MEPAGLVIFDCDGVLVDSEPISNRVLACAVSDASLPMSAEEAPRISEGMTLRDIQAEVERRLGRGLPASWLPRFEEDRAAAFKGVLEAVSGIAGVLSVLGAAEVPMCVASQASREKIELTLGLTGLLPHFLPGALFSSRMVARAKPHPDLFLHAAGSMGVDPGRCVVVEDGVLGVRGAQLAGMRALGYAPDGDAQRLAREGAATFSSMAELPALLGLS